LFRLRGQFSVRPIRDLTAGVPDDKCVSPRRFSVARSPLLRLTSSDRPRPPVSRRVPGISRSGSCRWAAV